MAKPDSFLTPMEFIEIEGFDASGERVYHWDGYCYREEVDRLLDGVRSLDNVESADWKVV